MCRQFQHPTIGLACLLLLGTGCAHHDESPSFDQTSAFGQTSELAPIDNGWPRTYENGGQTVVVYQPQIDDWKNDQTQLDFRAATAVTPVGATQPVYGVIVGRADTTADPDSRTVYLTNFVFDVQFPGQPDQKKRQFQTAVQGAISQQSFMTVSLDRILAGLKAEQTRSKPVEVSLAPPPMYYSDSAAILVIFTGEPQFAQVDKTQLEFAVNTNWTILHDPIAKQYYLLDEESWLATSDIKSGKWEPVKTLPPAIYELPATENWDDVRKNLPGKPIKGIPKVIVSTEPAELIVTDGPVKLDPIAGTTLQYTNNPLTPLFYNTADQYYYYLVAGRWFRTRNLSGGGWEAASAQLPDAFAQIPPESPVGFVLASVPGTEQAKDAVLLAEIPHKATININEAKVDVTYNGAPQFVSIQDTSMTYAVNTHYQVIYAAGQYYCCYQGVWFVSPLSTGPWVVCTVVPPVIYTIPPSSPVYNCTYVYVYGSTPTTVVVGYTGGYSGAYVAATGCLMFGAGMIVGASMAHTWGYCGPAFYSYGCSAHYSYAYGSFYRSSSCYGPYGGAGYGAKYNSATGTYSRSAYAYGPHGAASYRQAYNPYTHSYASHAGATNGYKSWGSSVVSHNGQAAWAGHTSNRLGTSGWAETSGGKSVNYRQGPGGSTIARTGNGKTYAGYDGNVYQKSDSGSWQKYNGSSNSWDNVDRSSNSWDKSTSDGLDRDDASRSRGDSNSSSFSGFHGFSGGGFHGGGFRR